MKNVLILILVFAVFPWVMNAQDSTALDWETMGQAQYLAEKNNKKVLVYSEAEWCTYCKKMEQEVFPLASVRDSLAKYFIPVRVDVESEKIMKFNGWELTHREFAMQHRVQSTPTFVFIDSAGKVLGVQPGFIPAKTFEALLGFVGSGSHKRMNFKEYETIHSKQGKEGM